MKSGIWWSNLRTRLVVEGEIWVDAIEILWRELIITGKEARSGAHLGRRFF